MAWLQRAFPYVSITLAVSVLALLLAVSSSKAPDHFREIDSKNQYLAELLAALDQRVASSATGRGEHSASIRDLASRLPELLDSINGDLDAIYQPASLIGRLRQWSVTAFNVLDRAGFNLTDDAAHRGRFANLGADADRFGQYLTVFLDAFLVYRGGLETIEEQRRILVNALRADGRDEQAGQAFRAGKQILEYLESGDAQRLSQVAVVLDNLGTLSAQLQGPARDAADVLLGRAPQVTRARSTMADAVEAMDMGSLSQSLTAFRAGVTGGYVRTLSMISDARVLLNLYTVLLLGVLAYFGLRLRASYLVLNRSHGELEVRVQERTADLEDAYENLKESQVQLVQAEKMSSLGQLVAGVMHEINTPLLYVLNNTSMTAEAVADLKGYVDATLPVLEASNTEEINLAVRSLMKRRGDFEPGAIQESLEEVASLGRDSTDGLQQISDLVQSLKDFSRLDRAAEDRFNVCEGIEKTLTITRNLLKYGIEVEKHFDDVDDIYCSPARINQIFVNLVTNAAQAMDGNGRLTISVRQQDGWVEIGFADTGCGIPEEHLNRIMDPFFTTKPVGQGTGLGLSIVRQIVEQHQGRIDINSTVGVGTTITIALPTRGAADEEAA